MPLAKQTGTFNGRAPAELIHQVKAKAADEGKSFSDVMREFMERYTKTPAKKTTPGG